MSFYALGQRIGANSLGLSNSDFEFFKQASDVNDVEHANPEIREATSEFWRTFCDAMAGMEKRANGPTQDYFVLKQLSEQPLWIEEFQKMAQVYAEAMLQEIEKKEASSIAKTASVIGTLLPGVASRAAGAAPTLVKSLLTAGIGTGMASGGLYWALQRAATEDSDSSLDAMRAKIEEYNKLKTMLSADKDDDFRQEEAGMQKKINRI